jgi:hypothetical protein
MREDVRHSSSCVVGAAFVVRGCNGLELDAAWTWSGPVGPRLRPEVAVECR